ncbi:MAG: ornithine cyclodeaminase family domain [Anaerococcus sp.]
MEFKIPEFIWPDFSEEKYKNAGEIKLEKVEIDGVAPDNFYLTSHMPTFYKKDGEWLLPEHNSLNCVAVYDQGDIIIKEIRNLVKGDEVVLAEKADLKDGILIYTEGFPDWVYSKPGKAVETSFSKDYDYLFELMQHERDSEDGYIVWVLGPSVVFDYDTRNSLNKLAENGYIDCLLGGNAMCTHDLEGGFLDTALGQNIYTQENVPMGHYNHLDLLNEVRSVGSIKEFIAGGNVKDGIIKTLSDMDIPFVLSGSIRDDGPLPEVIGDTEKALTDTKKELDKATLVICIATMLHSLSVANMASSYRVRKDGSVTPVYMYSIDVTENVVNKVGAARELMAFVPMVTNVQDFVVNCERALINPADKVLSDQMQIPEIEYVEVKDKNEEGKGEM